QALSGDGVKLVITGEPKGRLQRVDVLDPQVATEWGNKLGTPFGDMYSKAFGSCKPGSGEDAGKVECVAEQSKYVTYIFSGKWAGAQDIIPPDDTLKSWPVSKIIWHAKPQQYRVQRASVRGACLFKPLPLFSLRCCKAIARACGM
ncbi:DUF1131 family protein, partial [Pseudomonas aeruginosa]